jgi:hypothetical protein
MTMRCIDMAGPELVYIEEKREREREREMNSRGEATVSDLFLFFFHLLFCVSRI